MTNAPDFLVSVKNVKTGTELFQLDIKIKHFRQFDRTGRTPKPDGGHTIIYDQLTSTAFSAKCRMDEQFSRRKGLLVCLQKFLNNLPFRAIALPDEGVDIVSVTRSPRGMTLFIGEAEDAKRNWWL